MSVELFLLGKVLFEWLKKECKRLRCKGIVLDSGAQGLEAHKFYYREGMESTALHEVAKLARAAIFSALDGGIHPAALLSP